MKTILIFLATILLNVNTCDKAPTSFVASKISELKSKDIYNPPASIWEWKYNGAIYYYVTADCCDQFNELYNEDGNLICHPDGGYTGKGDGKCPMNAFSSDTVNLKRTLIWKDDRKKESY